MARRRKPPVMLAATLVVMACFLLVHCFGEPVYHEDFVSDAINTGMPP